MNSDLVAGKNVNMNKFKFISKKRKNVFNKDTQNFLVPIEYYFYFENKQLTRFTATVEFYFPKKNLVGYYLL